MSFSNKVVLITGGSRGIGFATAKLFSQENAKVIITSRDPQGVKDACEKLNVLGFPADIKKGDEVKEVVKKVVERFGQIDILVNNAGIFPRIKLLHEIQEDEWNDVIDVNLTGQFRFSREVIPHMQKTGGTIINVASDAGLKAYQGFNADAYSASKAGLILLTKCWALEYAKDGIRVNCVCPGVVDTDMSKPFLKTEKDREFMNADHPIGRIGTPEEVARSIMFLASNDSSWTTGAVLTVDGGESVK